jgi:hypothetical protein
MLRNIFKDKHFSGKSIGILLAALLFVGLVGLNTQNVRGEALSATASANPPPFAPGERLVFALKWTIIPAGEAVMEVMPMKTINGQLAYHFRLTAESNAFVDAFYKVRDCIDSFAASDMSRTVHYRQKQREGRHIKDMQVEFDWKKGKAQYKDANKIKKPINIVPGTHDPLSVFYFSRTLDFEENSIIQSPVTDGSKCVQGIARIIKKEKIEVPSGTYDTYLIEPEIKHIGGVFKKSKNAKIKLWITTDKRRIPVKIASEVAVGSFCGELIAIENAGGRT